MRQPEARGSYPKIREQRHKIKKKGGEECHACSLMQKPDPAGNINGERFAEIKKKSVVQREFKRPGGGGKRGARNIEASKGCKGGRVRGDRK